MEQVSLNDSYMPMLTMKIHIVYASNTKPSLTPDVVHKCHGYANTEA